MKLKRELKRKMLWNFILIFDGGENENKGVDINNFMENYIWDESFIIYEMAKKEGKLMAEDISF